MDEALWEPLGDAGTNTAVADRDSVAAVAWDRLAIEADIYPLDPFVTVHVTGNRVELCRTTRE